MAPQSLHHRDADRQQRDTGRGRRDQSESRHDDAVAVRNYDGRTSHEVTVRFLDAGDEVALERTYTLSPGDVLSVATRVERGVYRVEAHLEDGESASTECLVGTGPGETALVEIGNGLVSVSEGLV
jgi:hypothetical protein